jgi:hypothetical protein
MIQIRAFFALAALCAAGVAAAQQTPTEEPGWAKGRPKTDTAMKMAPVPAFPIPTAADQLPTKKFKLPPGFKVETWASGVLDAREIREGPKGTIVVSTLFVGNKVYAFPPGKREPQVIIDKMPMAQESPSTARATCSWRRTPRSTVTTASRTSSTSRAKAR